MMLVAIAIAAPAFAAEPSAADAAAPEAEVAAEPASEWAVPVRFAPSRPALDRSRGLPLPRNTRLNPTARNLGVVVGISGTVLATFAGSVALGTLARNPFPREANRPPGTVFF